MYIFGVPPKTYISILLAEVLSEILAKSNWLATTSLRPCPRELKPGAEALSEILAKGNWRPTAGLRSCSSELEALAEILKLFTEVLKVFAEMFAKPEAEALSEKYL